MSITNAWGFGLWLLGAMGRRVPGGGARPGTGWAGSAPGRRPGGCAGRAGSMEADVKRAVCERCGLCGA